jgi:cytochrome b pre-mRNA-processing protein 3
MFLKRWFGPRPAVQAGRALYTVAVAQARQPAFYQQLAVPDATESRFELYSLHVVLLLHRLKGQGAAPTEAAQALFGAYVQALDSALREMGVGDLSMAKKMRKLAEAFYGRVKAYDGALLALPGDPAELSATLGRTVYADIENAPVAALSDYAARCVAALATQDLDALMQGSVIWPEVCHEA